MLAKRAKVKCEDCGWEGEESEMGSPLSKLKDLGQRLEPGSEVPAGSCPTCSAFVYYIKGKKRMRHEL